MSSSRNFIYVIIIISLPFQFSFQLNFYTTCSTKIQSTWNMNKVTSFKLNVVNKITTYFAAVSAIAWIFISYKIRKRRLAITINFILSGIVWLIYIAINDQLFWLLLVLRAMNGVFIGFFQSVGVSYMMHFADTEIVAFHGCLIQFSMFVSLCLLNFLNYAINWKILCVVMAVQSFLFGGTIWLVPEVLVQSKSTSRNYIFNPINLPNLLVMLGIMFIQNFSGIGSMIDNFPRLMSSIGVVLDPSLLAVLTNFIGCISMFISSLIMDIVSIRYMWAFSSFGIVVSLIIYSLTIKIKCPNWLSVFSLFLYYLFFGMGVGPIPWLLCGALFKESVMIETGCLTCFMNRFMDIWFGYLLNAVTKVSGEFGTVLFNAAFSLLGCILGLIFIPEFRKKYSENATII